MRQQTLHDLPRPKLTRFGLKRTRKGDWCVVPTKDAESNFVVTISLSIAKSKTPRVYLLALNTDFEEISAELIRKFNSKSESCAFMKRELAGAKNKERPFGNTSPKWQYTYFCIFKGRATFLPHTVDSNGKRCRKVFTGSSCTLSE